MSYQNIDSMFFSIVKNHAGDRQTKGLMDRQNYNPQECASIAASRGKNPENTCTIPVLFFEYSGQFQ